MKAICALAIVLLGGSLATADEAGMAVDIRSPDGKVLIAADQIVSYHGKSHTLTLSPGVQKKLMLQLLDTKVLVAGVPFDVVVGGKAVYRGTFTSGFSSYSFATPVILVEGPLDEPKLAADQLQIQLGYPTPDYFKGKDPRADAGLLAALKATSKLAED